MLLWTLFCCSSEDAERRDEPSEVAEATGDELVQAVIARLCEADRQCEAPAFQTTRECTCVSRAEVTVALDEVAAGACVDALPSARIEPCAPFDLLALPEACLPFVVGPEALADLYLFYMTAHRATVDRDCGGVAETLCGEADVDEGCVLDPEGVQSCYEEEWTCDRAPSACLRLLSCS